jgi:hypothetical protein
MKVEEALARKESLFGREVAIEGFLVERAPERHIYLAPSDKLRDEISKSIRISLPFAQHELNHHVPAWLGGRYPHADPATLTGKLVPSEDGIFPATITDLTKFSVEQDDETIDVPLNS